MWKEKLFWFSQPSAVLNNYDSYFMWLFVALTVVGILMKVGAAFSKHPVTRKLIQKFANAGLWMGIIGLFWYGFRYESTPIFAYRFWAGVIVLISLIWLVFVLKYLFTKFALEKRDYDKAQLNSRYIPGTKR